MPSTEWGQGTRVFRSRGYDTPVDQPHSQEERAARVSATTSTDRALAGKAMQLLLSRPNAKATITTDPPKGRTPPTEWGQGMRVFRSRGYNIPVDQPHSQEEPAARVAIATSTNRALAGKKAPLLLFERSGE